MGQFGGQSGSGNISHIDKGAGVGHLPNLVGNGVRHLVAAHTNIGTPESTYGI